MFGILPAWGFFIRHAKGIELNGIDMSTMYYAYLAYRLAKRTGRTDVCALPSGISVPHMFIVTFVVMLPIALRTQDPVKGWEAGLTWVFVQRDVYKRQSWIISAIPSMTSARFNIVVPKLMISTTVFPSRAASSISDVMSAMASG